MYDPGWAVEAVVAETEASLISAVNANAAQTSVNLFEDGADHSIVRGNFALQLWVFNGNNRFTQEWLTDN